MADESNGTSANAGPGPAQRMIIIASIVMMSMVAVVVSTRGDDDDASATEEPIGPATLYADEGYELVWADEFDAGAWGAVPNPAFWSFEEGFSRNEEAQWYQEDNAFVETGVEDGDGGVLVIEARRESRPNPTFEEGSSSWRTSRRDIEYTSSSIRTRGKREWLYGRFEVRARVPIGEGMWPAIWTLGSARSWPGCGEIDIMEYYQGAILANYAWKAQGGNRWNAEWDATKTPVTELAEQGGWESAEDWADDFHVWRMDWDEERIELSIDGVVLNTIDVETARNPDGSLPFREPHYLLLNLAIGGTNGGDPTGQPFPRRYEIDWARVYQRPGVGRRVVDGEDAVGSASSAEE